MFHLNIQYGALAFSFSTLVPCNRERGRMYGKIWLLIICGASFLVTSARDRWVTIFTHGGGTHPMYFSLSDAFKVINDQVKGSVYARTTRLLREDPYFFQMHPQQGSGLKRASGNIKFDSHNGAHLFALIYDEINAKIGLPKTDLYSYGWTGLLSINARRAAARNFYRELEKLVKQIKLEGDIPRIRIIAYSHGGNMSLHLAEYFNARRQQTFVIDELILVATPVHQNTAIYLGSPLFKKIYLFYSIGDNIQVGDFLSSPTHSFAQHTFEKLKTVKIPDHVTQVQVRIFRKKIIIVHKDGTKEIIHRYDMIQPNHTEMFFFGWTPEWYRKYFPLKPLPVVLLMPYFLRTIYDKHLGGQRLRFTMIPDEERMTILNKKTKESFDVPFFDKKTFTAWRRQLLHYRPTNLSEYRKRMKAHWETAKLKVREEQKAKRLSEFAAREKKRMQRAAKLQSKKLVKQKAVPITRPLPKNQIAS